MSGGVAAGWKSYAKSKNIGSSSSRGSSGGSSSRGQDLRKYDDVERDVIVRSGLTTSEYDNLLPDAKRKLYAEYAKGSLTTTADARRTSSYTLPDGTVTDFAGAERFKQAEEERVRQELYGQVLGVQKMSGAQQVKARNGYLEVYKRPEQAGAKRPSSFSAFQEGFSDMTPYMRYGFGGTTRTTKLANGDRVTINFPGWERGYPEGARKRTFKQDVAYGFTSYGGYDIWRRSRGGLTPIKPLVQNPGQYLGAAARGALSLGTEYPLRGVAAVASRSPELNSAMRSREFADIYQEAATKYDGKYLPSIKTYLRPDILERDVYGIAIRKGYTKREAYVFSQAVAPERAIRVGAGFFSSVGAELSGELVGRAAVGPATRYASTKFGGIFRSTGVRGRLMRATVRAANYPGGVAEGVYGVAAVRAQQNRAPTRRELAIGGLAGGFMASTISGGIGYLEKAPITRVTRRGVVFSQPRMTTGSRRLERWSTLADYNEPLGDELADQLLGTVSRSSRVTVPSSITNFLSSRSGSTTRSSASTSRELSIARNTVTNPTRSMTGVPTRSFTNINTFARSITTTPARNSVFSTSRSSVFSSTRSLTATPTRSLVPTNVNSFARSNVPSRVPTRSNVFVPVGKGVPFGLLGAGLGLGRGRGGSLGGSSRRFAYAPSLVAIELGIRGSARTPKGGFTGLEIRPLQGFSRRRRKKR